jgi:hypothetical protein
MYSVARTLHGVRCSQCVYRWSVKSMLRVKWSVSRVVRSDEEEGRVARASARAGGIAGVRMLASDIIAFAPLRLYLPCSSFPQLWLSAFYSGSLEKKMSAGSATSATSSSASLSSSLYTPETYRALKTEQGVFMTPPYSTEIKEHWRFKDEAEAKRSSEIIWQMFQDYRSVLSSVAQTCENHASKQTEGRLHWV